MANNTQNLSLIPREANSMPVGQRTHDGYINATALCKAAGKKVNDYLRLQSTKDFLKALESETGIPACELVQAKKGGVFKGTWVHPQVAINLAQWASPKFAVQVSGWVFEWASGNIEPQYLVPEYLKRFQVNRTNIPNTHFSMLNQMTVKLFVGLEQYGYVVPSSMYVDSSLGKIFSNWLRRNGYDPDSFPSYMHEFPDGRKAVPARLYPNEILTDFNIQLEKWILDGRALKYFRDRDIASVEPLKLVLADILRLNAP